MTGHTVVLLRGLAREAGHWGDFPERLGRASPGMRMLTPDLPGNGRCRERASPLRIGDFATALLMELPAEPVHLVALSLGGMVALALAERAPERVASLVFINSSVAGLSPFWRRLRPCHYPRLLSLPWRSMAARESEILALTSNVAGARDRARPDWLRIQEERPVSVANIIRQLWAAARFRPPRRAPQLPGLVLTSRADRLVDWRCSRALSAYGDWPIRCHESAGHDLALDAPDWLSRELSTFWSALGPQASESSCA